MSRKIFQRFLPNPAHFKSHPSLKFLGGFIQNQNLWHLNRHSVSLAFFVGIFCALLPSPFQMVIAALLAILFQANLPISVSLVWTTNPITIPPIFFFTYQIGSWMLDTPERELQIELSLEWITSEISHIWQPLFLGSITCGLILGATAYLCIQLLWRWNVVKSWQKRKQERLERSKETDLDDN